MGENGGQFLNGGGEKGGTGSCQRLTDWRVEMPAVFMRHYFFREAVMSATEMKGLIGTAIALVLIGLVITLIIRRQGKRAAVNLQSLCQGLSALGIEAGLLDLASAVKTDEFVRRLAPEIKNRTVQAVCVLGHPDISHVCFSRVYLRPTREYLEYIVPLTGKDSGFVPMDEAEVEVRIKKGRPAGEIRWEGEERLAGALNGDDDLKEKLAGLRRKNPMFGEVLVYFTESRGCASIRTAVFSPGREEFGVLVSLAGVIRSVWFCGG